MARMNIDCHEDKYRSVNDWYTSRIKMASPTMDGQNTELVKFDPTSMLKKAAITSADAGAFNTVYDYDVFTFYATKANQYGVLPKKPWGKLGYRAVSAGGLTSGGITEGQSLSTAVEPTYRKVGLAIKEFEAVYDFSDRMYAYDSIADVVTIDVNRDVAAKQYYKVWNGDLLGNAETLAGYNMESLDRLIASCSEEDGCGTTSGDLDPWTFTVSGISRGSAAAATWADAYVNHNSNTDRTLTIALIDALRENVEPKWDRYENKCFVTGYDTWRRWSALEETKHRIETTSFKFTIGDGIQTSVGAEGGFKLSSWDGIPIIRDDDVVKDTISRVYLEDLDNLDIAMARPPTYTEADPTGRDVFAVGHVWRGVHYTMGETRCTNFVTQGKLRDLK
jgi:hypothetical protein